jgi:hypothetical protein
MEPLLFFIHCRGRLNLPSNILKGVCIRADSIRPYSKWEPSIWKIFHPNGNSARRVARLFFIIL